LSTTVARSAARQLTLAPTTIAPAALTARAAHTEAPLHGSAYMAALACPAALGGLHRCRPGPAAEDPPHRSKWRHETADGCALFPSWQYIAATLSTLRLRDFTPTDHSATRAFSDQPTNRRFSHRQKVQAYPPAGPLLAGNAMHHAQTLARLPRMQG
jgi:hypothetical protein